MDFAIALHYADSVFLHGLRFISFSCVPPLTLARTSVEERGIPTKRSYVHLLEIGVCRQEAIRRKDRPE